MSDRKLAVVTGASTGIGYHLAECCAKDGHDLLIAADETRITQAAESLRRTGAAVEALQVDLATHEGVDALVAAIGTRPVAVLVANAGQGLGGAFVDQDLEQVQRVLDLNVTGTARLAHRVARMMRARREGRILFTGSIAGDIPGSYQAVYNASKAFVNSLSLALSDELAEFGVSVTCLQPGPTDTAFFTRADMLDTPVGQSEHKADPAKVARDGYVAMMAGRAEIVSGWGNKIQSALAGILPDKTLAHMHRKLAEPKHH